MNKKRRTRRKKTKKKTNAEAKGSNTNTSQVLLPSRPRPKLPEANQGHDGPSQSHGGARGGGERKKG